MNGTRSGYVPRGFETQAQAPMPQVQGNDDMLEFLRQVARRQRLGQMASQQTRPFGWGAAGNATRTSPEAYAPRRNAPGSMEDLQLRQMQGQVQDAESIRGLRKSPTLLTPAMGGGVLMQYDRGLLNPIQEEAINPQNAVLSGVGAQEDATREGVSADDWQRFLAEVQQRKAMASGAY